jgi:hypothetical protein
LLFGIATGLTGEFNLLAPWLLIAYVCIIRPRFVGGGGVRRLNDVLVMVQYLVAVPIAVALHTLFGAWNPALSRVAMVVGISGMLATAALQFLLVIGALTFAQQVVPVSVALLVVGAWLVITGYLGRSTGTLPHGVRMGLLAATYVGYPIWAFWLGRRLLAQNHPEAYLDRTS